MIELEGSDKVPRTPAETRFFTVGDVMKHFDKEPAKLVAYVENGISKRVTVLGVHIAQLAKMVGIPVKIQGRAYTRLPEQFFHTDHIDNIGDIINAGHRLFPSTSI